MGDIDKIREAILKIVDPAINYSQQDFDKEFGSISSSNNDLHKLPFSFVNKSNNSNPEYATNGSSGFDLKADLTETIIIQPNARAIIPTGLFFKIPDFLEIQIRPRSGLAAKNGITVLNSPGTIDSDYRGEIKVILINHSDERFIINNGDRIAQAVVASVIGKNVVKFIRVDDISKDTERSDGGFGSTGHN